MLYVYLYYRRFLSSALCESCFYRFSLTFSRFIKRARVTFFTRQRIGLSSCSPFFCFCFLISVYAFQCRRVHIGTQCIAQWYIFYVLKWEREEVRRALHWLFLRRIIYKYTALFLRKWIWCECENIFVSEVRSTSKSLMWSSVMRFLAASVEVWLMCERSARLLRKIPFIALQSKYCRKFLVFET